MPWWCSWLSSGPVELSSAVRPGPEFESRPGRWAGSSAWIRALEKGFSEPFNPEEKASGRGFKDICLWKVPSGPSLEKWKNTT